MWPSWTNPAFLLLALLVPALIVWLLRQPRSALRFPMTTGLARLPSGRRNAALWGGALLRGLALLLLVIALAGPRWPDERTRVTTEGIAIMMVVDVSGSMAEPDFLWKGEKVSRLDAVKKVFRLFVEGGEEGGQAFEGRVEDLVGLVTFATRPECPCPLTLSHAVLLRMLDAEAPKHVPGESQTNISDALALGLDRLDAAGKERKKVLILLSDGEHNELSPRSGWTLAQAGRLALALKVPIYAIDAGGTGVSAAENATPISAETRAKAARDLQNLAAVTGGRYFQATDSQTLLDVCRDIDRQERVTIQGFQYRRYYEGFGWFALASFVVLALVGTLDLTVWRKVP